MKRTFIAFVGFFILSCPASLAQVVLEKAGDFYPRHDWIEMLQYRPGEVFPIQFKVTACPLIEVKIDGQSFWLTFDFGSAGGMMVTTAIEDKITYAFIRDLSATYADGRPRGRGKEIVLNRVEVFGKTYDRLTCDLHK